MPRHCDYCGDRQRTHPLMKVDGKLVCRICFLFTRLERLEKMLNVSLAYSLKDKGYSNSAIAKYLGISESKIRHILKIAQV